MVPFPANLFVRWTDPKPAPSTGVTYHMHFPNQYGLKVGKERGISQRKLYIKGLPAKTQEREAGEEASDSPAKGPIIRSKSDKKGKKTALAAALSPEYVDDMRKGACTMYY
ncbi:hypothetical protein HO173_005354 [Letharia columbiana]|uniref:Uncharacterized protein n=1 Tax=Letharia columbiana TaxID=112416 RepID=A0A8H6FXG3_9LECA|nr:uncharacterized protein HO173_005354 [Letharia columbiana]KAF6236573.1 hypothetical protein HO173_005354 [Letharia columbiana]